MHIVRFAPLFEFDSMQVALNDKKWYLLVSRTKEHQISKAFELFHIHGVEPILIKGYAVDIYFPADHRRIYTDIDLSVSEKNYLICLDLLAKPDFRDLPIDLHRELRHLDSVPWEDLLANSISIDLHDSAVRVLAPEDQFRVTCVHWLTDGGAYKHRLWDVYYSVQNRPENFDWDRCLNVVSQTRRKWIITTIGLAHRHLGLDIDDLPFAEEAKQKIPDWIERCLQKEWAMDVRLQPVIATTDRPRELFRQIVKRIPPNPIRATIEFEGDFDDRSRVPYQIRSLLKLLTSNYKTIFRLPLYLLKK